MYNHPTRVIENKMEENFAQEKEIKHKIHIPRKLPSSLARKIQSPFWKKLIKSIEKKEAEITLEIVKTIDKLNAEGKLVKLTKLPSVVNIKRKPIKF